LNRSIDSLVARFMREASAAYDVLETLTEPTPQPVRHMFHDAAARMLLQIIALNAPVTDVYRALSAVGAPSDADLIGDGIQAVRDHT